MNVLVTGGAGFIGSHLTRSLTDDGAAVTVLDSFEPQVHGRRAAPVRVRKVRTVVADVRDRAALVREVRRAHAVVHLAAAVGVGQSQYEIHRYVDANIGGTALLLDVLANTRHQVRKLVVAGSMSSYGEGAYECARCGRVRPPLRTAGTIRKDRWDPDCPNCGGRLTPVPTRESDRFLCSSIYAVTKMAQEELVMNYGVAYDVPVVTLRFFNVYGPGQSLSNPYTGVAAIFMSRLKNGNRPAIYEDGEQTRDFICVRDIVQACKLVLRKKEADHRVFNVGTGKPTSVVELARLLSRLTGAGLEPQLLKTFRRGDIRHCFADVDALRSLGFRPSVSLDEGLGELVEWAGVAEAKDGFVRAQRELARRGLV